MSDFYSDMQGIASSLLGEFSQGFIEYVELTPRDGPDDEPGEPTESRYRINATVRGVKFSYVDNSLVVASDLQITIPADVIEPLISGSFDIDGVRYKIVKIIPKPAAGAPVVYTVIVRS